MSTLDFIQATLADTIIRQKEAVMSNSAPENHGEGNRTAAKEYNERTKNFVDEGKVKVSARSAADVVDSAEGEELRKAEKEGRKHAHR